MKAIFIDTWGWINLFNRKENRHQQVRKYYQDLRSKQASIVTTDYVLDEVYTLLFKRLSADLAVKAILNIADAVDNG